jgi:RNA polymerase sigma-70 factor, ECF subfamily
LWETQRAVEPSESPLTAPAHAIESVGQRMSSIWNIHFAQPERTVFSAEPYRRLPVVCKERPFTCRPVFFCVKRWQSYGDAPAPQIRDRPVMGNTKTHEEIALVRQCLSGSEEAWNEFYNRYVGLVRSIVRRQRVAAGWDDEDTVQNVFTSLIPALKNYDPVYSLPRFVCIVAERTCIQEYRLFRAAKRDAETLPVDHHDSGEEGARILRSAGPSPEDHLIESDLRDRLRVALRALGTACRELLKLRYFEQLSYKEIAHRLGASENTLAVRAKRCLAELSGWYGELGRTGYEQ